MSLPARWSRVGDLVQEAHPSRLRVFLDQLGIRRDIHRSVNRMFREELPVYASLVNVARSYEDGHDGVYPVYEAAVTQWWSRLSEYIVTRWPRQRHNLPKYKAWFHAAASRRWREERRRRREELRSQCVNALQSELL